VTRLTILAEWWVGKIKLKNTMTCDKNIIEEVKDVANIENKKDNGSTIMNKLYKEGLQTLIENLMKETERPYGCFCYFITITFNEYLGLYQTSSDLLAKVLSLISNTDSDIDVIDMSDIAFYVIGWDDTSTGESQTFSVFLAVENLIANNSRIENNLTSCFLKKGMIMLSVKECKSLESKIAALNYVVKNILATDTEVIKHALVINPEYKDLLAFFVAFLETCEIKVLITYLGKRGKRNGSEVVCETSEDSKTLTLLNLKLLFKLFLEEKN